MKTNAKLLILSFTVVVLTASVVTWKFVDFYSSDSKSKEQFLVQQQVKTLAEAVSIQSDFTVKNLMRVVAKEDHLRFQQEYPRTSRGLSRSAKQSPFVFVAAMESDSRAKWSAFGGQKTAPWVDSELNKVIEKFSFAQVKKKEVIWQKVMGPQNRAYLGVAVEVKKKSGSQKILGVLPIEYLTRVGAMLKGGSDLFMVIDSRGRALYFPEQQYLGATVTDDPIVKEILASKKTTSGSGEYRNLDGVSSAGAYYKIGSTNMHAILSRPFQAVSTPYARFFADVAISALVMFLAIAAVFGLFWNTIDLKMSYVRRSLANMVNGIPVSHPPVKDSESVYLYSMMTQVERRVTERTEDKMQSVLLEESFKTFKRTIESVFVALRDPVTAILGHAQLIQNELKNGSGEKASGKAVKIEEESRSIRDWTERLQHLSDINVENVDASALTTWIDEIKTVPEGVDFNFEPVVLKGVQSRWEMEEDKPEQAAQSEKATPLMEIPPAVVSSTKEVSTVDEEVMEPKESTVQEGEDFVDEAFQSSSVDSLYGKAPLGKDEARFLPELPGELKFVNEGPVGSVIKNEVIEKEIQQQLTNPEYDPGRIEIKEESLDLSDLDDFIVGDTAIVGDTVPSVSTPSDVKLRKPHVRTDT